MKNIKKYFKFSWKIKMQAIMKHILSIKLLREFFSSASAFTKLWSRKNMTNISCTRKNLSEITSDRCRNVKLIMILISKMLLASKISWNHLNLILWKRKDCRWLKKKKKNLCSLYGQLLCSCLYFLLMQCSL